MKLCIFLQLTIDFSIFRAKDNKKKTATEVYVVCWKYVHISLSNWVNTAIEMDTQWDTSSLNSFVENVYQLQQQLHTFAHTIMHEKGKYVIYLNALTCDTHLVFFLFAFHLRWKCTIYEFHSAHLVSFFSSFSYQMQCNAMHRIDCDALQKNEFSHQCCFSFLFHLQCL